MGSEGDVQCLQWKGKPLGRYGAKEFNSHSCVLRPNITFEFLFQFERVPGGPHSCTAACRARATFLSFICTKKGELFSLCLEGRALGVAGRPLPFT